MKTPHNNILHIGRQRLDLSEPVVMTIVNVTPDSFWEGSRRATDDDIQSAVAGAVAGGAAILDVGGYSSRPGAAEVSPEEEFGRVARALRIIRDGYPDIPVSIDTFRASVARRTVEEFGPCVVNDISAGQLDPEMIGAVAALGVPYIAMHMRGTPSDMQSLTDYGGDIVGSVKEYFREKIAQMKVAGIADGNIILDPGFGFAKTTEQNYELMAHMHELLEFGYPILSGISRKSMIYKALGTTPAEAAAGTAALNWESLRQGALILRVHDTREASDIVKLYSIFEKYAEDEG